MIINNTSITGIFKYDSEAEYEKGDFVVFNGCLYICNATTSDKISGISPETDSKNFTIYLGNQTSTVDEYFEYVKNPKETEDKYISMPVLSMILQKMYFGLDDSGVISNYINSPEDFSIYDLESLDNSTPLIDIIKYPTLNNGVLRVKRDLSELVSIIPQFSEDLDNNEKSYYSQSHKDYLILKQYTYDSDSGEKDSTLVRYRVQELIDPIYGNTYYRYTIGNNKKGDKNTFDFSDSVVTEFMNNFSGDTIIGNKFRGIESYVSKLNNDYNSKLSKLENTFRFRNHPATKEELSGGYVQLKTSELGTNFNKSKSNLFTILVRKTKVTGQPIENYSLTVDSIYSLSGVSTYRVGGTDFTISVSFPSEGGIKFERGKNDKTEITNVYFQSNFIKTDYTE